MTDTVTEQLADFDLVIGGESTKAASGSTYDSVDPFTGKPWARVPDGGAADVDRAVAAARAALDGRGVAAPLRRVLSTDCHLNHQAFEARIPNQQVAPVPAGARHHRGRRHDANRRSS